MTLGQLIAIYHALLKRELKNLPNDLSQLISFDRFPQRILAIPASGRMCLPMSSELNGEESNLNFVKTENNLILGFFLIARVNGPNIINLA
ncbi:hypothetical protein QE152_g6827 [Popillia japonica]|uniref:Uncharacterized protein n=1 Tax=Popillia japonica TaxID=7064 RepID=A0AAW1MHS3_POPJA